MDSAVLLVVASFASFHLLNRGVERLIPAPQSAQRNRWKWRNIWTSFVHSLLTGSWSLLAFYLHPKMAEDLISTHSPFSHSLVAVSIGYFLHDFVDMISNQKFHQSWELLFHHTVNKALRIAAGAPLFVRTADLHRDLGIEMLDEHLVQLNRNFCQGLDQNANPLIKKLATITKNPFDSYPQPVTAPTL